MNDVSAGAPGEGDAVDPLEGPTSPIPGSRDPDNEVVPADQAEPVGGAPATPDDGEASTGPDQPTSSSAHVRRSAERLDEIATELRDSETDDTRAAELAREAADLIGSAAAEVDRALRAAGESD